MYGSSKNSFADLMSIAKQNADQARKKSSKLDADSGRPRKADPKQVKLKEGVAKFLAKRDEEEKRKKECEKLKKDKLLQLRQQDRKATNRVRKMLSMTKSANKSCVDDARDCLNDSVTAQAQGDFQPDEDDYGYTSNYADMMHKKMMEKYKSIPIKPAFPQTSSVPIPKHQSLIKNGTGWRKSGSSQYEEDDKAYSSPEQDQYEEPPSSSNNNHKRQEKPSKPNRPPPPDYRALLQMAQEKKFEPPKPVKLKPMNDKNAVKEVFEYGRPMTAKEKKAFLEQKELKERVARRMEERSDKNNNSNGSSSIDNKPGKMPSFKIPKARGNVEESTHASSEAPPPKKPRVSDAGPSNSGKLTKESSKPARPAEPVEKSLPNKSNVMPNTKPNGVKPASSSSTLPLRTIEKPHKQSLGNPSKSTSDNPNRDRHTNVSQQTKIDQRSERIAQERMELVKEKPRYLAAFNGGKERERDRDKERVNKKQPLLSNDSNKPRPGSSREVQPPLQKEKNYDSREKVQPGPKSNQNDRNRPPMKSGDREDMRPPPRRNIEQAPRREMPSARRELPMKAQSRMRDNSPPRMRPPNPKSFRGRAVIDSDEDYDSEMDDFIDDSEVDMGNISAEISRIFNYDRRRYQYDESDDECMESSVAQQMREEQRSLRLGIQEDLEDIAREEEEKRRKILKTKKR